MSKLNHLVDGLRMMAENVRDEVSDHDIFFPPGDPEKPENDPGNILGGLHGQGIALVFSRTDTKWFHRYVRGCVLVCFIKKRINFVPAPKAAEYAAGTYEPEGGSGAGSMLLVYGEVNRQPVLDSGLGTCMERL